MPNLNERQFRQQELFNDSSYARDDTVYYHFSPKGLKKGVEKPLHIGTGKAAVERSDLTGNRDERMRNIGGKVYAGRIRGEMFNDPDMPVTDELANLAHTDPTHIRQESKTDASQGYKKHYGITGRVPAPAGKAEEWAKKNIANLQAGGTPQGVYYENMAEDIGSTSAVLPSARDFEIMETVKYSGPDRYPRKPSWRDIPQEYPLFDPDDPDGPPDPLFRFLQENDGS